MSAKRRKAPGRLQKSKSKKTAKRLAVKKERLEKLAAKRQTPKKKKRAKRR